MKEITVEIKIERIKVERKRVPFLLCNVTRVTTEEDGYYLGVLCQVKCFALTITIRETINRGVIVVISSYLIRS